MKSKSLFSESELKTAKDIFQIVSKLQFHSYRVSLLATGREICHDNTSDEYLNKALALTIEPHPERTYCKTFNVKEDLNIIETWLKEIEKLERLPIFSLEKVQYEAIVFSPSSFGFILHELLGHRLESDDYSQPLKIGSEKCANYIAEDTIGAEGFWAYTPFDDFGIRGENVCLLDGRTGSHQFLGSSTGNLRASAHQFHAIPRQRCTEVTVLENLPPPAHSAFIEIKDIFEAELTGDYAILISASQFLQDKNDKRYILPRLKIKLNSNALFELKAFGERQQHSPAGGCHKGLQRGLPISFFCPSAWIESNSNHISIETH
jgi:hypothetical protein